MPADETLLPWFEALSTTVEGAALIDVHTHIGLNDPDGFRGTAEDLVAALELPNARGVVFPMHEPGGYRGANDAVLAAAEAHSGRLIPFCRVDPGDAAPAEVERSLAAGARGVKLHPRAEGFALSHPEVARVVALCHERRAPLMVHAGRGIPALGRDALALSERFPSAPIILAHAGISDLSWLWRHAAGSPSLFYDTSWWNPTDLLALFALVPPGQILNGSDAPYGTPLLGAVLTLRCALQVGLTDDQVAGVMGAQAQRLLSWEPPLDLGPAAGAERLSTDVLLDRVYAFLAVAMGMLLRDTPADEQLALARLACDVGEDAPQAPACRSILALLDLRDRLAREHDSGGWVGTHQVTTALAVAKTPDVALPPPGAGLEVDERLPESDPSW